MVSTPEFVSNVWKDNLFANKVVFCTGGSGSICSAQVRALVSLGANACIVGRNDAKAQNVAKEISKVRLGCVVLGIGNIDVRSLEDLERSVRECIEKLGGIDYVIVGAAGNFLAPIESLSSNAFRTVVNIDLIGSFNTVKATMPHLLDSVARTKSEGSLATSGRIIFISATFHYTGMPFQTHAACAKAGVDALSASVALEYGPRGIQSNVISPGAIQGTEGVDRLFSKDDRVGRGVPLGRHGLLKEISDATVYLLSESGNYVNGHVLVVDGGAWRVPQFLGLSASKTYPDILEADIKQKRDTKNGTVKARI
ncbi:Ff.00g064380.m01.CDS01 [Fusarium sp. VM40]|nr:Ff.00g064380.m01.CDS01 [Fusarium sp. VM40]